MYGSYKQLNRYREAKGRVRVAIYSRCSGDEQRKNGYTVKDQLDFGYVFAKENELIVTGEYVDEGISATLEISKRKDLARLIEDAKAGKFDIIIFKCIDRFFRNVGEYYECQKQLQKAGVTWVSIEESDLDPEDPEAAFKINIYLSMAEYEARKASKRVNFNNKMRMQNKQVVTGDQCFFFPWTVVGEPRNRHLERNMEKADIFYDLLEHFELHQSKSKTLAYINSKYDMGMSLNTLGHLLEDTLMYGEYKGVEDYVEPYVSKERFDRIQETLKRNARYPKNSNNTFLFTGIVRCRCCGYRLAGNYSKREGYKEVFNYRCSKAIRDKACENKQNIVEHKIESQLLANLEQYITNEIVKVESIKEEESPVIDNSKKIAAIKKEMERLTKAYRKGRIEEDEYDEDYEELERELRKLEEIEKPKERDLSALKKLMESDFRTMYDALDREHKKAFWRNIIQEFSLGEDRKIIPESIVFF